MLAIFKREFKSYFQNVIGWLFVAALLAVYGLYFYVYNLKNGYPYISYDLNGIGFIMMIAVPILTMRSLSDEKKTKTDQLMLTSPVSVGRIVAGKYLAMAAVYTIDIALLHFHRSCCQFTARWRSVKRMWLCLATGFTVYHASPWDFLYRPYLRV